MKDIKIKRLTPDDAASFQELIGVFHQAFNMEKPERPETQSLLKVLNKDEFIAVMAQSGDIVVGGLTAYMMPMYYEDSKELYLYDMAVHPSFQGQGIGSQLMEFMKDYCQINNITTLMVEAHAEDKEAIRFYHSTGGKAEQVTHFNYTFER